MHFALLVLTPDKPTEADLERLMRRFNEELAYDEGRNDDAHWDWYQVGGRWTGHLTPGSYDPEKDPRNIETCHLCAGTGLRIDAVGQKARLEDPAYTCNGCKGAGKHAKWPTQWASYEGDQLQVKNLKEVKPTFAVLNGWDGTWHERPLQATAAMINKFSQKAAVDDDVEVVKWAQEWYQMLEDAGPEAWATIVDCHI